jgi:hypothetical protein
LILGKGKLFGGFISHGEATDRTGRTVDHDVATKVISPNTIHLTTKKRVLNRRWTRMDADEEGLL